MSAATSPALEALAVEVGQRVAARLFAERSRGGRRNAEIHLGEAALADVIQTAVTVAVQVAEERGLVVVQGGGQ